jgi:hypothetical protein
MLHVAIYTTQALPLRGRLELLLLRLNVVPDTLLDARIYKQHLLGRH